MDLFEPGEGDEADQREARLLKQREVNSVMEQLLGRIEDLARLERKRKGKKLSNTDWVSKSDPEAKIAKMKDGTTHLAYKPEHAVDLDTGAVVAAELHPADEGDTTTLSKTLAKAEANLEAVDAAPTSEDPAECVADKGYHSRAVLRALNDSPWKTRIAAPKQTGFSRWHGDEAARRAVTNNRARLKSGVAREAFKLRAEIVERCFAHNLDRGGMRRTWLRGRETVHKRYLLHIAGHNLSLLMRQLIGAGTPREAVAGGYGGIFVLLTPTGAMLVARGGARKAARRLSPPHSSSGSESRKKPLNQRAVRRATPGRSRPASRPSRAGVPSRAIELGRCPMKSTRPRNRRYPSCGGRLEDQTGKGIFGHGGRGSVVAGGGEMFGSEFPPCDNDVRHVRHRIGAPRRIRQA